jgi:ATP-dependent helicase Lhr and Lhr-like helicase
VLFRSLTTAHSFELEGVARYLNSASVKEVLIQALLDAPMFTTRWRWVAGVALALPRWRGGKKVPPQLTRMAAEDLVGTIFPDQVACAENLVGEREVPDHPLVSQTIFDCLHEAMDIEGLQRLLVGLESGRIQVVARDLTAPSPLAQEVLTARPYAYLDDAPLEERRTQAVMSRRWLDPDTASDLGQLDAAAIARVREEAWPDPANADELHDALVWLGFLTEPEAATSHWSEWLSDLAHERRVTRVGTIERKFWVTAERLPHFQAVWPEASLDPEIASPADTEHRSTLEEALIEIVRGRLEGQGPITPPDLAVKLGLETQQIVAALAALETEGFAMSGRFTPGASAQEWCERRLLARIHRYTVKRLRAEIEPVAARDYLRFLFEWQRVAPDARMDGPTAVSDVVEQLAGFEAPAAAWEKEILPARLASYSPGWLDDECLAGHIAWARLTPMNGKARAGNGRKAMSLKSTPISLVPRRDARVWASLPLPAVPLVPGAHATRVADFIRENGASFFEEIIDGTHLLRVQAEEALSELVALGLVSSDSFGGLRALLVPASRRKRRSGAARPQHGSGVEGAGRWALAWPNRVKQTQAAPNKAECVEHIARTLLKRYGVVFLRMLEREAAWLPKWRDLLRVYRKLEARGEIRGGRFVAGFSGEQFALPEAIGKLREVRRQGETGTFISLSGADPLNLAGILTPGPKLPALTGNRVLYRDGIPIALLEGDEVRLLEALDPATEATARMALLGHAKPAPHLRDLGRRRGAEARRALSGDQARPKRPRTPGHFAA